jgi:hypothetical protein
LHRRIVTLTVAALVCAAAGAAFAQPADIVVLNAKVFTARDGDDIAQGFAIRGDRFVAVGSTGEMRAHVGANTRVIDLGGRLVTPGLADGHFHNEGRRPRRRSVGGAFDRRPPRGGRRRRRESGARRRHRQQFRLA